MHVHLWEWTLQAILELCYVPYTTDLVFLLWTCINESYDIYSLVSRFFHSVVFLWGSSMQLCTAVIYSFSLLYILITSIVWIYQNLSILLLNICIASSFVSLWPHLYLSANMYAFLINTYLPVIFSFHKKFSQKSLFKKWETESLKSKPTMDRVNSRKEN